MLNLLAEHLGVNKKGFWKKNILDNSNPLDVLSDCNLDFPDLKIILSGIVLEVSANDYVIDVSPKQDRSECELAIKKHNAPFNVLGTPLF